MAAQGATLQNYNNQLVKCIEDLREKREEVNRQILAEEEEKAKKEKEEKEKEAKEKADDLADDLAELAAKGHSQSQKLLKPCRCVKTWALLTKHYPSIGMTLRYQTKN